MEWFIFPIKQTIHGDIQIDSIGVYESSPVWHLLAACDVMATERCTTWLVVTSIYGGIFVSLSSLYSLFVFYVSLTFLAKGWEVMDIQRTRTASETGTGRQFDTTQRHLIMAVVDKTQSCSLVYLFVCLFLCFNKHKGPHQCSHTFTTLHHMQQFSKRA